MYFLHIWFSAIVEEINNLLKVYLQCGMDSIVRFMAALILTLGAAASIIYLSEQRKWTWLKKIY